MREIYYVHEGDDKMTKSAMIKEMIMQLLSDGSPHSVSEMKDYLSGKK